MKPKNVSLSYRPLKWQREFHSCTARYRIVCNGRQTGKTTAATHELVKRALGAPGGIFYWVDLDHGKAKSSLDILKREYPADIRKLLGIKIRTHPDKEVTFTNGARISYRTAQNPDSLVGETLDGVVINEAGLIESPDVWYQMLRPALTVKQGFAIFVSTPRRRNWFYTVWKEGQSGCKKWTTDFDTRDHTCCGDKHVYHTFWNPLTIETAAVDQSEVLAMVGDMTDAMFRIEALAEFSENVGSVFENYPACIGGSLQGPAEGASYYIGTDLGRTRDYTVVVVLDRLTKQVVHFARFNNLPWPVIEDRISAIHRRYNDGKVIVDSTGVGSAVCSNLRKKIQNMEEYNMGNTQLKVALIGNLISTIEHEEVRFPEIPVLIQELSEYSYNYTKGGSIQYHGRQDGHDDAVVALALACWPLQKRAPVKQLTHRQAKMIRRAWRV